MEIKKPSLAIALNVQRNNKKKMSSGGHVPTIPTKHTTCMHCGGSVVSKMSEGGQVDLEENDLEGPGTDISDNIEAKDFSTTHDNDISPQPEDSDELGDDLEDEDKRDSVSLIMRKLKSKR